MDYTDDITEMLRTNIFGGKERALAYALQDHLHAWEQATGEDKERVRLAVLRTLRDALLPKHIAGGLDYGDTAALLIHGALYDGLDLATLRFRLDDLLA